MMSNMSPLRKLLTAVLVSVLLAQIAAMAMVARSQVMKAELREAVESARRSAAPSPTPLGTERPQAMTVGYAVPR